MVCHLPPKPHITWGTSLGKVVLSLYLVSQWPHPGGGGGGGLAGAKFGTAKCGTAKLYHIWPWYLRTEATFFPLPDLCTFSLHYNPGHWEPVLAKKDFTLNPISQMIHNVSSWLSC